MSEEIKAYAARFSKGREARTQRLPADLAAIEAEAIFILREVAAAFDNPVMLYSIGKDSTVMAHLALKAFWPEPPPFPLLHVDSLWEFSEMATFRDALAEALPLDIRVHVNEEGRARAIDPFVDGSAIHTQVMRTEGLLQVLRAGQYDAAIGGARRDEEKSRAKERIFSFRNPAQGWDPRRQRPELWTHFNTRIEAGESMRVFPLSNWTELDIWRYIEAEAIPIVPLYLARPRPVVERDGGLLMVDDERMALRPGEEIQTLSVRFRTLGCYPLTAAEPSKAGTLRAIVDEIASTRTSERAGRVIDRDSSGSMEQKKREGYF
jgi:sulfate adenylyltransferase subunit 2